MATVIERVRAGATLLDATVPNWAGKIDADRLDLRSCEDCVFGQAFDDHYINACNRLRLSQKEAASLGFCSEAANAFSMMAFMALTPEAKAAQREKVSAEYRLLRSAWIVERDARLIAAEEARIEALPEDVGCVWGAL